MNEKMHRNTKTQKASRRLMLLLLTLILFSQTNSSAPVDLADKKGKDDGTDLYNKSRYGGNNSIARRITISSGGGSGGSGAGSGSGSGGSSSSPRTPGGAAVVPVYGAAGAARAANNNTGHHSSGNRLHGSVGVITALSAAILLSVFTVYLV